jgi:hypothetical protein
VDPPKQVGVAILISDKVDFRIKSVRRNNEVHFILVKKGQRVNINSSHIHIKHRDIHLHLNKTTSIGPKSTARS